MVLFKYLLPLKDHYLTEYLRQQGAASPSRGVYVSTANAYYNVPPAGATASVLPHNCECFCGVQ